MEQRVLVCSFGNRLKKDDGFGPCVVEQLGQKVLPENVALIDFGTSGFKAALEIGDYEKVIIIDAVRASKEPGTIYRMVLNKEDVVHGSSLSSSSISLHESELERVLTTVALIGPYPREVIILGCEPADISLGLKQSKRVSQATGEVISMVMSEIAPG